jgi:putative flippase GtrA
MKANLQFRILFKFFSVGMIATLVHSTIFSLCIALEIITPQIANLFAYLVALTVSYVGQRYWTFATRKPQSRFSTIPRFISVSLLGYGLNAFWVYTATTILGVSPYYSLLGIGLFTPVMTFFLLQFWVFGSKKLRP